VLVSVFPELEVLDANRVEGQGGDLLGGRSVHLEIFWVLCEVDDASQDAVHQLHVQLTRQELARRILKCSVLFIFFGAAWDKVSFDCLVHDGV